MDISGIIVDLKSKETILSGETKRLEAVVADLRERLTSSESVLAQNRDDLAAIRMSIESLEMVGGKREPEAVRKAPAPAIPIVKTVMEKMPSAPKPKPENTRRAKKVGKFNPKGEKLGEWGSINKCAKEIGWTNTGVSKFIQTVSPEKQIKLRGYYLKYIA